MQYRIKKLIATNTKSKFEYYVQYKFMYWWFTVRGTYGSRFQKARFSLDSAKDYISRKNKLYKEEYIYPDKW